MEIYCGIPRHMEKVSLNKYSFTGNGNGDPIIKFKLSHEATIKRRSFKKKSGYAALQIKI
jgi:hypothetical protein